MVDVVVVCERRGDLQASFLGESWSYHYYLLSSLASLRSSGRNRQPPLLYHGRFQCHTSYNNQVQLRPPFVVTSPQSRTPIRAGRASRW